MGRPYWAEFCTLSGTSSSGGFRTRNGVRRHWPPAADPQPVRVRDTRLFTGSADERYVRRGSIWRARLASMEHAEVPDEVLDDVASVVGAEVTLLSRLAGGVKSGSIRVQLAGRSSAVLKAEPRTRPNHLDDTLRGQRIVEHMRGRDYPTPAW